MKILAVECSAKAVSVAIAENGVLIYDNFLNIKQTHSETLLPLISAALDQTGNTLQNIDAFAVAAGPGSFTGVRIGISVIKGLAYAENKPIFTYSTLEAIALMRQNQSGVCLSLIDARANRYYAAFFEINQNTCKRLTDDEIITQNALEKKIEIGYNNLSVYVAGDGAPIFCEKMQNPSPTVIDTAPYEYQRATGMAVACSLKSNFDGAISPAALQPIYMLSSQAERMK